MAAELITPKNADKRRFLHNKTKARRLSFDEYDPDSELKSSENLSNKTSAEGNTWKYMVFFKIWRLLSKIIQMIHYVPLHKVFVLLLSVDGR